MSVKSWEDTEGTLSCTSTSDYDETNDSHPWKGKKWNLSINLENISKSAKYEVPDWCLKRRSRVLQNCSKPTPKKKPKRSDPLIDMNIVSDNILKMKSWLYEKHKPLKMFCQQRQHYCGQSVRNETAILYRLINIELNISLPQTKKVLNGKKSVFKIKQRKAKIREKYLKRYRWVFIPSHDRIGKQNLNLIERNAKKSKTTIYVKVVRPSTFQDYIKVIGHYCPIIQLPNEGGIGYSREWIMKIAHSQSIEYIWMMDDNVSWFKEYIPETKENRIEKDRNGNKKQNLVKPEYCFQLMEKVFKRFRNKKLVAMSPRRQGPFLEINNEFSHKPANCVMLLDVKTIKEYNIQFDQRLQYFEDMIFAAECHKEGLKTCIWNRFVFYKKPYTSVCKPNIIIME